ncbi:hypothetical protein RB653_007065 [Dictyostelium firmibasis]|uniref:Uncharacterized protein n=1 Tax=Dictyostelium firmibasis TaxID=79012 RepID=A0AAN7YX79_9MYCE
MTVDNSQIPNLTQPESFADLWDGYENVSKATEKGVLLLKDITKFFKKRIQSEDEYSKTLSKLVLKFEPMAPDGYIGPRLKNTWDQIKLETLTHSNHHENICNNISTHIIEPIEGLIVDLEQKMKSIHVDAEKSFIHYQESVAKLKKAKQNYDRLCKDSFEITGVSKGETQKVQKRAIKAAQDVIKADKEYRAQINETNSSQKQFLTELIPKIMNDLQRLEMVRIHMVKSYFHRYFKSMESTPQKFNTETENLLNLINSINNEDEIQDFVRKSKTTHKYPKPFEYEPYLDRFTTPPPPPPPQISSPQLLSPRDFSIQHSSSSNSLPIFPTQHQLNLNNSGNSITNSLSLSSDSLQNVNNNNNNSNSNNNTPTKEKKPSGWGLKRFSTSVSSTSDRKLLNKQIQSIGLAHNGGNIFNNKIEEIMSAQKKKYPFLEIPFIVVFLKHKLVALDVYKTQGIFRVPGNVVDINSLKKRFDEGNYEVAPTENVYTIASLLKLWLREITEPLFPLTIYDQCIENSNKREKIFEIVSSLPILNQKTISYIIDLLQECGKAENVEHNKMNFPNLAMVFSPCFLRCSHTDPNILLGNIFKEKEFVQNLIEYFTPLQVNDSLEGPPSSSSSSSTSINQSSIESPPSSPLRNSATNSKSANSTPLSTPIKSSMANTQSTPNAKHNLLSPIVEQQSPNNGKQPIALTQTYSHLNIGNVPSIVNNQPKQTVQTVQQQQPQQHPTSVSAPATPHTVAVNPKINQIKAETITTPQKSTDGSTGMIGSPSAHLMSPSEVKRRSNAVYLDDQERCKQRIDELHTQVNELYSDITTIETTTYFAMQSSLLITKLTKSLESFLTVDMWNLTLQDIKEAIEKNKFVSPPPINFKIPSKMPKLSPIELVQNEQSSELLRSWLSNVTLTVNRINEYLCYLGGVVIRIHSPDTLLAISNLFTDYDLSPQQNPKFVSLTLEQSTIFIQKTMALLEPLNPFTSDELNINVKVQDTITPASFSPALISDPDCNSPPTNSNSRLLNASSDLSTTPLSSSPSTSSLSLSTKDKSGVDNNNNSPSIVITSTTTTNNIKSGTSSSNTGNISTPKSSSSSITTTSTSNNTTTTNNSNPNEKISHAIISPSSSTTSFKFDDDDDEEEDIDLLEMNNKLHSQLTEELKKKQQQYKQLIFDVIDMMKDKKKLMNSLDLTNSDSQLDIKSIAKLSLSLKRTLDNFTSDSDFDIEDEVDPIINKENDSFVNLKIMTSHFISRIVVILTTILSISNEFNSNLYELLLPFNENNNNNNINNE